MGWLTLMSTQWDLESPRRQPPGHVYEGIEVGRFILTVGHTVPWAGVLEKGKTGENKLSASDDLSGLPDCGCHVISCFTVLSP